jgi:hypothetical protein
LKTRIKEFGGFYIVQVRFMFFFWMTVSSEDEYAFVLWAPHLFATREAAEAEAAAQEKKWR